MSLALRRTPVVLIALSLLASSFAGCSADTHGNRRGGQPMITRVAELRKSAGQPVMLVGTARQGDAVTGASIELRGGSVDLPDYTWPDGYVGQTVMISGTLIRDEKQVYRLGEIGSVSRWSR